MGEVNNNASLMLAVATTMMKKTMEVNEEAIAQAIQSVDPNAAATAPTPANTGLLDIYA